MARWTTVQMHTIHYGDFDDVVKEVYGHEYECVADMEWNNDSSYVRNNIRCGTELANYECNDIRIFQQDGYYSYMFDTLLQDLVNRGVLPEGNWTVNVTW